MFGMVSSRLPLPELWARTIAGRTNLPLGLTPEHAGGRHWDLRPAATRLAAPFDFPDAVAMLTGLLAGSPLLERGRNMLLRSLLTFSLLVLGSGCAVDVQRYDERYLPEHQGDPRHQRSGYRLVPHPFGAATACRLHPVPRLRRVRCDGTALHGQQRRAHRSRELRVDHAPTTRRSLVGGRRPLLDCSYKRMSNASDEAPGRFAHRDKPGYGRASLVLEQA